MEELINKNIEIVPVKSFGSSPAQGFINNFMNDADQMEYEYGQKLQPQSAKLVENKTNVQYIDSSQVAKPYLVVEMVKDKKKSKGSNKNLLNKFF